MNESELLGVISDEVRQGIFRILMDKEIGAKEQCYWMSFYDPEKPKGKQFLGSVIVLAPGFASAMDRLWKLGINPGGEVRSYVTDPHDIKPEHFDRLLSFQELVDARYCVAYPLPATAELR